MSLKNDFLAEISQGDFVSVMYGQNITVTGQVVKLTQNSVCIQTATGRPRIDLESIISYDEAVEGFPAERQIPQEWSAFQVQSHSSKTEISNAAKLQQTGMSKKYEITKLLRSAQRKSVAEISEWDTIKDVFYEPSYSRELKNLCQSVISTFQSLYSSSNLKQREKEEKIHNITAKGLMAIQQLPEDDEERKDLYKLLAAIHLQIGNYERAENYFANAKDFMGAAYSAILNKNNKQLDGYLDGYIHSPRSCDAYLYNLYAESAVRRKNITALQQRLFALDAVSEQERRNDLEYELLCGCGCIISEAVGLSYLWEGDFCAEKAVELLKTFLNMLPDDWEKDLVVSEPARQEEKKQISFVGQILSFNMSNHLGFIKSFPNNRCFHLKQVETKDVLRQILAKGSIAYGLEVSYELGQPHKPGYPPQANRIHLTERGIKEAEHRLGLQHCDEYSDTGDFITGNLMEFDCQTGFGKIYRGDEQYNVIASQVVDPYLKAYLYSRFDNYDIPVMFQALKDKKGKNISKNIRLANEDIELSPSDIKMALRSGDITQEELDSWKQRKLNSKKGPRQLSEMTTDFYSVPFEELVPYVEDEEDSSIPVKNAVQSRNTLSYSVEKDSEDLPSLEQIPREHENKFLNLLSIRGNYYEKAHRHMIAGELRSAEEEYIHAIQANDRIESAIADLVNVYLRDDTHVMDALDLMTVYGEFLPDEKRTNLLLQIYLKGKERFYRIRLCHLLEEIITTKPIRISAKLHYLGIQANALCSIGCYKSALTRYAHWKRIYDAEVQDRGQAAVISLAKALQAVRHGEAICLYYTGEKEQAKKLAKELLRVSSSDVEAQRILNDTLGQADQNDGPCFIERDAFQSLVEDDSNELVDAEIYKFAQTRMKNISLSNRLKSGVENGEYTGTPDKAEKDIRFLLDSKGKTPSIRSEILLCAANIVHSVQSHYGKDPDWVDKLNQLSMTSGDEKKYIARAMASYGDFLMEAQRDQDSARLCYLQAIEVLSRSETDRKKSMKHYVDSFFYGQMDMAQIVRNDINSKNVEMDMDLLSEKKPQDIGEFLIGILKLNHSLDHIRASAVRANIIEALYKNSVIDDIVGWLNRNQIEIDYSRLDGFAETMKKAYDVMSNTHKKLISMVECLPTQIMSMVHSDTLLRQMGDESLHIWLDRTDRHRLADICSILSDFRSYYTIRDFQSRSERFNTAIQQIVKLQDEIVDCPTLLSYDCFFPVLEQTRAVLREQREQLYRELPPEIQIQFTDGIDPYLNHSNDGMVNVHLTVRNSSEQGGGAERQLADNITLKILNISPGVEFVRNETPPTGCIYGGSEMEAILLFQINSAQILSLGTFDIEVQCSYRYNERPNAPKDAVVVWKAPVVFQKSSIHSNIVNPYLDHIGKEMEDVSMFYGRNEIIDRLRNTLRVKDHYNYGHGILMYGQTRAGKSSIRIHFVRTVREDPRLSKDIVLADLKNLNAIDLNELSFYTTFLDVLQTEIRSNHPDVQSELEAQDINLSAEKLMSHPQYASVMFNRYMDHLYNVLRPMGKMVVLVADEFSILNSAIQDGRMPIAFMQAWKAMLENYGVFALCFGQDDIPQFVRMHENAFARMNLEKITYLEEQPAKKLMDDPIAIKDEAGNPISRYTTTALDTLYNLTSGSAFLIIKVCSLLVDYLNQQGAERVTPGILDHFLSTTVFSGNSHIEEFDFEPQINDRASPELKEVNRRLLEDIAKKSTVNGWANIGDLTLSDLEERQNQTVQARRMELLKRLEERDVIEIREGRRCRIRVELLTKWLLH